MTSAAPSWTLLAVDDEPNILAALRRVEQEHRALLAQASTASRSDSALAELRESHKEKVASVREAAEASLQRATQSAMVQMAELQRAHALELERTRMEWEGHAAEQTHFAASAYHFLGSALHDHTQHQSFAPDLHDLLVLVHERLQPLTEELACLVGTPQQPLLFNHIQRSHGRRASQRIAAKRAGV